MVENLEHYIHLALKARNNKTEFPFIVFDKKNQGSMQEVLVL
jgi:hypothetical protein